jgi:hypothetical protein
MLMWMFDGLYPFLQRVPAWHCVSKRLLCMSIWLKSWLGQYSLLEMCVGLDESSCSTCDEI